MVKYMGRHMAKERDETSGQYRTVVDDGAIVAYIREQGGAGTSDVADRFDYARPSAYRRLRTLERDGRVVSREIGNSLLWLAIDADQDTDAVAREHAAENTAASGEGRAGGGRVADQSADDSDRSVAAHGDLSDPIEHAIAALDTTDERREAVRACVDHLRERGTSQRKHFLDDLYPEHAAGFESKDGWWNKIGKQHLTAVADAVDVVKKPAKEGSHTWRYVGEHE